MAWVNGVTTGANMAPDFNNLVYSATRARWVGLTRLTESHFIDVDFDSLNINFDGQFFIQTGNGFVSIGTDTQLAITANTRFVYANAANGSLFASDDVITTATIDTRDIYIIGVVRAASKDAKFFGIDRIKINGLNIDEYVREQANVADYVKSQKLFGMDFALPVCDLYGESGINQFNWNTSSFTKVDNLHPDTAAYVFISQQTTEFIRRYGGFTDLTGKTIGVFGGSFSVNVESQACKDVWVSELGVTYTDYGVGGAGFARVGNYIDTQADTAEIADIYILWCSTNDLTNNMPVGNLGDTTNATQYGGMYATIQKLYAINPDAKILIFTTLRAWQSGYQNNRSISR